MGIRFNDDAITTPATPVAPAATPTATPTAAPVAPAITEVPSPTGGFTLDLTKGAILDITKENPGVIRYILGAGWDASNAGQSVDLDISVFMLNANGKVTGVDDIVYFRHLEIPGVKLNGDNRTGDGEGDDETINIDLSKVDNKYQEAVFVVNIFEGVKKQQTFGMIQNSYVRLLDADNGEKEVCRFRLKDEYSTSTAVVFAKLKRNGANWQFEAIGDGKIVADLNDIAAMYM